MDSKAILRLDSVVRHIDAIQNDLHGVSLEAFKENDLLLRATCFSVVQIGESMNKLETLFGEKYPNLPWRLSNRMRIFLVHDYDSVDAQIVYETVKDDLPVLKAAILAIKNDMRQELA